ncbi:Mu transposase C-terminal domain-containing protein [Palleronia sp. LCG004]|uniref:Mu transposase C-terminal domain-containing protein n=1 Tax=Palleronia sp. LCG004 TaxID=3079304 RepID=UPI0029421F39|nr:Mu transposase C-terminal domain-containing protein [Palleronia sp. LCG004]WOI56705.1 Mu transposase C-terminal domain-containing protein [Palleronia sp. LCG004]
MSRFLISNSDRLFLNKRHWRLGTATGAGYVFEAVDDPGVTLGLSSDELAERLMDRDSLFERGYFDPGRSRARIDAGVECLRDLPKKTQHIVLWRWGYVEAFLALYERSLIKRTETSISCAMYDLQKEVDTIDVIRQRGNRKKRAGRKSTIQDAPCPRSVLEWVRRFENSGRDPLSLVPGTHRSGNAVSRFCIEGAKLIAKELGKYATIQRPTKREVARDCVDAFRKLNKERKALGIPPISEPSKRCIERKIGKLDPYQTYAGRYGVAAANKKFAAIELGIKAGYPMERIEIDEWNVDVLTLITEIGALDTMSEEQRAGLIHERLWLYVAIDCATRCILALRLASTPNADDAVLTLADATRDKSDLSKQAGCVNAWTQHGGLAAVVTDNGAAFTSIPFVNAIHALGGGPERPPAGIASLRGRIERLFRSFGTELMALLAGRTFSNPIDRGDYPSEDLAVHSRETLLQILTLYVVDIYHHKPHAGLGDETPADCWKRLEKSRSIVPPPVPQTRCRALGIELTRKVTRKGVTVLGNDYACDALREMLRHSHDTQVTIRVDPAELGWIMVRVDGIWHVADALRSVMNGVSLADWRLTVLELRSRHRRNAALHEDLIVRTLQKIREINAAQLETMRVRLPYLSAEDLKREERQLGLGLTIDVDAAPEIDLPNAEDGFGQVVPLGDTPPDLFSINGVEEPQTAHSPNGSPGEEQPNDDWGLEED